MMPREEGYAHFSVGPAKDGCISIDFANVTFHYGADHVLSVHVGEASPENFRTLARLMRNDLAHQCLDLADRFESEGPR